MVRASVQTLADRCAMTTKLLLHHLDKVAFKMKLRTKCLTQQTVLWDKLEAPALFTCVCVRVSVCVHVHAFDSRLVLMSFCSH